MGAAAWAMRQRPVSHPPSSVGAGTGAPVWVEVCVPCYLALSSASVTPSRPCHVSSPRHVERSVRISSHYALLFAFLQGLWDLSCRCDFRHRSPNPVAVEQPQGFVQPPPTPPLPAEALSVLSPPHMAPDLLFYPVLDEAETLAGMSNREVVHPTAKDRVNQLHDPIHWLRLELPTIRSIRQQSTGLDKFPVVVDRGEPQLCCEIDDLPAKPEQEGSFQHHEASRAGLGRGRDTERESIGRSPLADFETLPARVSGALQLRQRHARKRRIRLQQRRHDPDAGGKLLQDL